LSVGVLAGIGPPCGSTKGQRSFQA